MIFPPRRADRKLSPDEDQVYKVLLSLYQVYNRRNKNDIQEFEFVTRVTKAVFPKRWEEQGRNGALVHLFELAVNRLPDDELPEKFDKSWQWIAKVLCGYVPKSELHGLHEETYSYKSRYAYVKGLYDRAHGIRHDGNTFKRRVLWPITATLVSILKKLEQEGPKEGPSTLETVGRPPAVNPFYAERPQLRRKYNDASRAGAKLIVFYGQFGVGKTWAARELARLKDGSPAPLIKVDKGRPHLPDVQIAVRRFEIDTRLAVSNDLQAHFTLLLTDENGPDCVLFDGLDNIDELMPLLPSSPIDARIVATCRHRENYVPDQCVFIEVETMAESEAVEMIQRRLPQMNEDDATYLARGGCGYPLAIWIVCAWTGEFYDRHGITGPQPSLFPGYAQS